MSKLKFMNIEVDNLTMSEAINAMDLLIQNKENECTWIRVAV